MIAAPGELPDRRHLAAPLSARQRPATTPKEVSAGVLEDREQPSEGSSPSVLGADSLGVPPGEPVRDAALGPQGWLHEQAVVSVTIVPTHRHQRRGRRAIFDSPAIACTAQNAIRRSGIDGWGPIWPVSRRQRRGLRCPRRPTGSSRPGTGPRQSLDSRPSSQHRGRQFPRAADGSGR